MLNILPLSNRVPTMPDESLLVDDLKQLITQNCNRKQFTCNECGKSYALLENLKRHLHAKSPEESCSNSRKHNNMCQICQERFLYSRSLEIHMYSHSVSFLFSCPTCHKEFKKPYILTKHMKTHLKRDFECEICKKSFLN